MLYYHTLHRTQLHPSNMTLGEMSDRVDLFSRWNCRLDIYLLLCTSPVGCARVKASERRVGCVAGKTFANARRHQVAINSAGFPLLPCQQVVLPLA